MPSGYEDQLLERFTVLTLTVRTLSILYPVCGTKIFHNSLHVIVCPARHRQGGVWSDDGERKWWWNGIISLGIKNRSLNWIDLRRSPQFRSSSWSAAWLALKLKSVFKKKNENRIKKETKKVLSPPRQPRHICARTGSRGNCARVSCKLPFSRSAVKQKYINDAQTFFSPHWLAFLPPPPPPPSRSTVPLAPISQHSLIFSPSLTYPQPLPPSTLFTPAALLSVPPLQATCYSVQGGCRQHYSSSAYCCCRRCCCSTTLFHPPPPPLSVVLSDNQTFSLVLPPLLILLKQFT